MKRVLIFTILSFFVLASCHHNSTGTGYCTVKGTVKGLNDGAKLELQDQFNHYEIVGKGIVKNGTFEIYPNVSAPTHVYLYTKDGIQLKDFILEPGTIFVEVNANDENDYRTGASGTPSNDIDRRHLELYDRGDKETAKALLDSIIDAEQIGALALDYAYNWCDSTAQALEALDRLSPELAKLDFVAEFRDELTRRMKTEVGEKYIDMEYPDVNGKTISLSSVVNNPSNRYVLVDFWATWCGGCVESIPELVELYAKYHEKGLEIYGVSMDPKRCYDTWENFLTKNKMTWINVCNGNGGKNEDNKAWYDYALSGIPTTLLIDCQNGKIIARNHANIDAKLSELLQ
jgi:thiol-disulfide isomerase/thioredoxin